MNMERLSVVSGKTKTSTILPLMVVSCAMLLAALLFSWMFHAYVLEKAEENVTNLLLSHKGIHHYVQQVLIPFYAKYQSEGEIAETFYAPELLSSSFIVRRQHLFYNKERTNEGLPELYYKLAAINPRNPVNQANDLEKKIITMFNADKAVKSYREILDIGGNKYLYVAIPFLKNDARCLRCHGNREDAPSDLQARYPGKGGFNEQLGEIRAITSIRAPMEHEYMHIYIIAFSTFIGAMAFGGLFFFNTRLRTLVRKKTISLEQEIEERKFTEEELKIKECAIAASINAISLADLDGNLTYVNKSFLSLWGYDDETDVIGRPMDDFWQSREDARIVIRQLRKTGQWFGEIPALGKDEKTFIAQVASGVIKSSNEQPLCIMASYLDITDKRKFENQIRKTQRLEAMGTLAGGIAHDFNNILAPIIGYAEIVQEELPEGTEVWQNQQAVIDAGLRAKDLVKQILVFARQGEHENQPVQMHLILKEALKLVRSSIPTTIDIRQKIEATTGVVFADPTQIHQVIMNLCTNAYHAMLPSGGVLGVSLTSVEIGAGDEKAESLVLSPGPYLRLEVSDTGCGMERKTMDRIFEPYFTTKEKGKGTGLGLAMVHGIVNRYGGTVLVYSEFGVGTSFNVYLPHVLLNPASSSTSVKRTLPRGNERILVVDDEESVCRMAARMLESLGYQVTAFTQSTEAWEQLLARPDAFDLVITDMTMPAMTGVELAQRYLSIRSDALVILCTGFSELITEEKAKAVGIRTFLMKPIIKKDMAMAVRTVLDEKKR